MVIPQGPRLRGRAAAPSAPIRHRCPRAARALPGIAAAGERELAPPAAGPGASAYRRARPKLHGSPAAEGVVKSGDFRDRLHRPKGKGRGCPPGTAATNNKEEP